MRMWNVPPSLLCQKHLLGEHVEMHTFVGSILKGVSLTGYINGGLVETQNITKRHAALAKEMLRRGLNHKSALPEVFLPAAGHVDTASNLIELARRCPDCAALQGSKKALTHLA